MGSNGNRIVWGSILAVSLILSIVILAEIKDFSILPTHASRYIDHGICSKCILAVFVVSLTLNTINTLRLFNEARHVAKGLKPNPLACELELIGNGLLGLHAERIRRIYGTGRSGEVTQAVSLNAIRNRLHRDEWFVRSCGQLLMTMGLIGTVLGLGKSLEGLSDSLSGSAEASQVAAVANESHSPIAGVQQNSGLNDAIGGMSTAFATTLLGAIFGGILLRLLVNCTQCLADQLVDDIEITTELQLVPLLRGSQSQPVPVTGLLLNNRESVAISLPRYATNQ